MTRRIRLLWLIDSLTVGGAESLIVPFARRLDRTRYDLSVCSMTTISGNPIEQRLQDDGVPVMNLHARNLRDRAAFRRLADFVRSEDIDLVHAHLTYSAIWSAWLSRRMSVPSVASLHVAPSATRAVQASRRQLLMTELRDRLMQFVLNRWSNRVIMVSAALRDTYLSRGGIRPEKIRVVHNGIEVDRFRREHHESRAQLMHDFGIPPEVPIVVTVSVLRPAKGIEVLLESARQVHDAYFLIVGDGPKKDEWTELGLRSGIGDRIRWGGYRRDVETILSGCDLFVHPSLDDAFPTVLLEAMAAGLPVVASRVGGVPEIVEEGVTGHLVTPDNPTQLAAAITDLLCDPATTARMREAARETAARRFSTEAWIERLAAVYDEVLEEAG